MSTVMTMHGKQVWNQWELVQFSDSRVSLFKLLQRDAVSLFLGQLMQMWCLNVHY